MQISGSSQQAVTELVAKIESLTAERDAANEEAARLGATLDIIRQAACGEEQVADDDTLGLRWIWEHAKDALSGSRSALDAVKAEARNEMLGMVVGSLRGYPDCGGDIGVMKEVDRLVEKARREGAAKELSWVMETLTKCLLAGHVGQGEFFCALRARAAALREGRE